jgi:hypothetical protein
MARELLHTSAECVDDELNSRTQVFGLLLVCLVLGGSTNNFNTLLYNMISVGIMNTAEQNLTTKQIKLAIRHKIHVRNGTMYLGVLKLGYKRNESLGSNILQGLLNNSATVHLHGQLGSLAGQQHGETIALLGGTILKQLLEHVIAKHVRHETVCTGNNLVEDKLLVHFRADFESLLDKPGAVLVLAKGNDVANQVDQLPGSALAVRGPELVHQRVSHGIDGSSAPVAVTAAVSASSSAFSAGTALVTTAATIIRATAVVVAASVVSVVLVREGSRRLVPTHDTHGRVVAAIQAQFVQGHALRIAVLGHVIRASVVSVVAHAHGQVRQRLRVSVLSH